MEFSIIDVSMALFVSFLLGLFIFMVYKKTFSGVMYSNSFGISLISMAMITTVIILAITSNIILSLGMVGALSIVRFRTAVKEPMDISFLYWAISIGIIVGAGLIPLAIVGTAVIGLMLFIFSSKQVSYTPYLLITSFYGQRAEEEIISLIKQESKRYLIKSKSVKDLNTEIIVEVNLRNKDGNLLYEIDNIEGVNSSTLVSYNGEYMA